jgi:hypothetical protein
MGAVQQVHLTPLIMAAPLALSTDFIPVVDRALTS